MTTQYRIYCGRNIGQTSSIPDMEVSRFIHEIVVPRFLVFTIISAQVYFSGEPERNVIFEILDSTYSGPIKALEVAEAWKSQFAQESVLITSTNVDCRFV